jgi:hypothetical protein
MSFARFSEDSDVYIFEHVGGFIECCGCAISEPDDEIEFFGFAHLKTPREALTHLDEHEKQGHSVWIARHRIEEGYPDLDVEIQPYVTSPEAAERQKAWLKDWVERSKKMPYKETVEVRISKVFYDGKPTAWEIEVRDHDGSMLGEGTASDFMTAWDEAYLYITKDYGEIDSIHNSWVDFDANRKYDGIEERGSDNE